MSLLSNYLSHRHAVVPPAVTHPCFKVRGTCCRPNFLDVEGFCKSHSASSKAKLPMQAPCGPIGPPKAPRLTVKTVGPKIASPASLREQASTAVNPPEQPSAQPAGSGGAFVWTRCWYPLTALDYLDATKPTALTVLGCNLVVWRDSLGQWRAFRDACPHRAAPLSEGAVNPTTGMLQCAYHGEFCIKISAVRAESGGGSGDVVPSLTTINELRKVYKT